MLNELVFVGGSVTGLLITDPAAGDPRPTLDVDAIAEITSYAQYALFGERLRASGFSEDLREGAPVCRWVRGRTILDVMPIDSQILGFSNRWYRAAMDASHRTDLAADLEIRVISAPYFVATKLDAFTGRGKADLFGSADLEDIIAVVDGRTELVSEVEEQPEHLRAFIRAELSTLVAAGLVDALPGFLLPDEMSQSRVVVVMERIERLIS
ncbi:MAG TPA: hypothetical protein VGL53_30700 [Bryobacteraceae bacterium]|jgi:hypothetical protein